MIAAALLSAVWVILLTRLTSTRERVFAVLGSVLFVTSAWSMAVALTPGPLVSAVLEEAARWAAVAVAVYNARRGRVIAALCVGVSFGVAEAVLASLVSPAPVTDAARILVTFGLHAPLAVWFSGRPRQSWCWVPAAIIAHVIWNGFVSAQDALALSATAVTVMTLATVAARLSERLAPPSAVIAR